MILSAKVGLLGLYHRLIRGKLLQEHAFGQPTLASRMIHLRPVYGLVFSAPAVALMAWYSGLALSTHYRHVDAIKSDEKLTPEIFQLHLHDKLSADIRRLSMPEPLANSDLPTYGLFVSNEKLAQLDQMLPPDEGKANYVEGLMQHKNKLFQVEARYRGAKSWHWNYPQKSWKLRVKGNHVMFDGLPTFNFVNTPDPMPFNEQMVLDTARDAGLLTPSYYPFRLLLNNLYLGVYFFEGQPDEGLLRRERRMPGSIYSGAGAEVDPKTRTSSLFSSAANWKKVGAIGDKAMLVRPELEALLQVVSRGSYGEFDEFARDAIDIDKFATLDAIDVVFGNNQHDYHQNHKLYFDPYKNRFEPIATDFRDMEHERVFNRTENPLLLRLKALPDYLTRRNRKVFELLGGACAEAALRDRVDHWLTLLKPDQERDPYWDAYELLPVMGTYFRQMVRPMNRERQWNAAENRLVELGERVTYLKSELQLQSVTAHFYRNAELAAAKPLKEPRRSKTSAVANLQAAWNSGVLDITVDGHAGYDWLEMLPESSPSCAPAEWEVYADRDLDQKFVEGMDLRLVAVSAPQRVGKPDITLYPGVALQEVPVHVYRGRVRAVDEPRTYRFFVRAKGCMPAHIRIEGRNAATLAHHSLTVSGESGRPSALPEASVLCDGRPGFIEPGQHSVHPFCYPFVSEETVRLGPGVIKVAETRVFSKNQTVEIEPGTTLQFSEGASLISYGRVIAEGTADKPIRFVPEAQKWGGVTLQGPATAGSRFRYVEVSGGTHPERGFFDFPGMVNVHDSRDIHLEHVRIGHNLGSDDALHVAYVEDFSLEGSRFESTFADAVDLEYTQARIARTDVVGVGDDAFDLMGSRLEATEVKLVGCKGNAISAGERSDVALTRSFIAQSTRAILIKNASSVSAKASLLYQNQTGVRLEPETEWYPGSSAMAAEEVAAIRTKTLLDGMKKLKSGDLKVTLGADELPALRQLLLGEGEWNELEAMLARLSAVGGKP